MDIPQGPASMWIAWVPVFVIVIAAIVRRLLRRSRPSSMQPADGWKWFWYSNPADPSLFVRKRWGYGYTLNFGNRWSWLVMAVIFGVAVAPFFFVSAYLQHLLTGSLPK